MGLIDPVLDLGDGEIVLASHLSGRGLALGGPSLDGIVVAQPVLLMAAPYPVQLWRGHFRAPVRRSSSRNRAAGLPGRRPIA